LTPSGTLATLSRYESATEGGRHEHEDRPSRLRAPRLTDRPA